MKLKKKEEVLGGRACYTQTLWSGNISLQTQHLHKNPGERREQAMQIPGQRAERTGSAVVLRQSEQGDLYCFHAVTKGQVIGGQIRHGGGDPQGSEATVEIWPLLVDLIGCYRGS